MSVVDGTWEWLTDPAHWTGPQGVLVRTLEHLRISALALALACALALPIGVLLGHWGRGGALAINVGNVGRAVPTFGVLVILASWAPVGVGDLAAVLALAVFAVPPLLTNAYVGMRAVEPDVREAARGMGMTGAQLLRRVELPLALPLLAAGFRTATVQVVATATLAALVAGGGLGRFIVDGYGQQDYPMMVGGALLVALLSVATELGLGLAERRLTPGARREATRGEVRAVQPATGS